MRRRSNYDPTDFIVFVLLVVIIAIGFWAEFKARQDCISHGGQYVVDHYTPYVSTTTSNGHTTTTVSEMPVYICKGAE